MSRQNLGFLALGTLLGLVIGLLAGPFLGSPNPPRQPTFLGQKGLDPSQLTPQQQEALQKLQAARRAQQPRDPAMVPGLRGLDEVDLTPEQKTRIEALRAEMRKKSEGLDAKGRREARREFVAQVKGLLTPEQRTALEAQGTARGPAGKAGRRFGKAGREAEGTPAGSGSPAAAGSPQAAGTPAAAASPR